MSPTLHRRDALEAALHARPLREARARAAGFFVLLLVLFLIVSSSIGCATGGRALVPASTGSPTVASTGPSTGAPNEKTPGAATLLVEVRGAPSDEGSLALALFADARSFDAREAALRAARLPLEGGGVSWRVAGLPVGTYALVAYHDRDDDGELDRGAFGVPSEAYGFSNDARRPFGPPSFEEASFRIEAPETQIALTLR